MTPEKPGTPRKATFRENAILTMKLIVVVALLGAALWGVEFWTAAG
jgi:hypothetical protein